MRDTANRYNGLPPRTPEMLFNIVRKFYRGAVSHFEFIQNTKEDVNRAYETYRQTGEKQVIDASLAALFCEFHFYVTCWLQIDLSLYRLSRMEEYKEMGSILEQYRSSIATHLKVREEANHTDACVKAQWSHFGPELSCVAKDEYWFDGVSFTVDETSLATLHQLYQAIMANKK